MKLSPTTTNEYGFSIQETPILIDLGQKIVDILMQQDSYLQEFSRKVTHHTSLLYMIYWYHRTHDINKKTEIINAMKGYLYGNKDGNEKVIQSLLMDKNIEEKSREYVNNELIAYKTVDLVFIRESDGKKEILVHDRSYYPLGQALPGGFILDSDESNNEGIPGYLFACLRIGGSKILEENKLIYGVDHESKFYFVKDNGGREIRIHFRDTNGYKHVDNLKYIIHPTDYRHLVDTIGIQCELIGDPALKSITWKEKDDIMDPSVKNGGFTFPHHRDIVAHLSARNPKLSLQYEQHHEWIRSIINNPENEYLQMRNRLNASDNHINTSFPELAPVVHTLLSRLFSEFINNNCKGDPTLNGLRDKTITSLRHCILGNRTFCPYLPTLEAIMKGITFFDLVARINKGFYDNFPLDSIYEHNPREKAYASYHMYRYEYRWNDIRGMVPGEIIIPTFEGLGATDLMKVRGVPIWFIGLSTDFIYVDEFEQSPEEFFMHDVNHSYRMIMSTNAYKKTHGLSDEEFVQSSNVFIRECLESIRIFPTDSQEERELKKLKKIILFEIVHEDARVFTRDSIGDALQIQEGGTVPFEVPYINADGLMEMVDTLDTCISPLSYTRNKLQHGFYDKIDVQMSQIVHPNFRTSDWITRAAYELLKDLQISPKEGIESDETGNISYEWLLARTCSFGPDNAHESAIDDTILREHSDGNIATNPKRYSV